MNKVFHPSWQAIVDWTSRMAQTFGGIVYDKSGKSWDWGQALCREVHGPDWNNHPDFEETNNIPPWEPAPGILLEVTAKWEGGEIPDWVDQNRTKLP